MPLGSLVCPTEFAGRQGALAGSGGDVSPSFLPVFGALMPCHICHTYHTYSVLNRPIKKSHSTLVKGVLGSILLLLSCIKNGIPPSVSMITHRNDFFFSDWLHKDSKKNGSKQKLLAWFIQMDLDHSICVAFKEIITSFYCNESLCTV